MLSTLIMAAGQNKTQTVADKAEGGEGRWGHFHHFKIWESNHCRYLLARKEIRKLRREVIRGKVRTILSHVLQCTSDHSCSHWQAERGKTIKNRMFPKWFSHSPGRVMSICWTQLFWIVEPTQTLKAWVPTEWSVVESPVDPWSGEKQQGHPKDKLCSETGEPQGQLASYSSQICVSSGSFGWKKSDLLLLVVKRWRTVITEIHVAKRKTD